MSLKLLKSLFSPDDSKHAAHVLYVEAVTQARKPFFYQQCEVADNVDGRFDVIVLHLFLVIHRLRREESDAAAEFIRLLSEVFFADMDRSLREMGSTDTGVGIRIKKMVQAFYGRLQSYERSIADRDELLQSLARNIYREKPVDAKALDALADYVQKNVKALSTQKAADIIQGQVRFTD